MTLRHMLSGLLLILSFTVRADEPSSRAAVLDSLDPLFEKFMQEQHIPGLVYGVVADGELVRVRAFGVQNVATQAPVTADSVFRIASMSKNFTALAALKLRDAGKLGFDAPAEKYVRELTRLQYPTRDSPRITVRDLLSHAAGFVTDDPWGDRQLDMSPQDFSRFVAAGVPFSRAPGLAYEYSNFGYALAGRIVTVASKTPFAEYITRELLRPLGMNATTYDIARIPADHRAIGYRWENEAWREEPALGPGEFGAMGGIATSGKDYARYVAWVLSAWPPRDDPDRGPLRRASIREIARPANFAIVIANSDPAVCARTASYGLGMIPFHDCVLGQHFGHSGGLPGYGSNVLFLPERGVAVFAFTNRTYAPASRAVRDAATLLVKSGLFPKRESPPHPRLAALATEAARIYEAADVLVARDSLAGNFLLDRDAATRNAELRKLRDKLGSCKAGAPAATDTAMAITLQWTCEHGSLKATLLLAPTTPATLQRLEFSE